MEENRPIASDTFANGHSSVVLLSSNWTLFWRVFLPVFGTVFLSGFSLLMWLTPADEVYLAYSIWWPRGIALALWLLWLLYVKMALWPLKRLDADDAYVYVTNYWTTVRYPWSDVANVERRRQWAQRRAILHLKGAGRFGQHIVFLPGTHCFEWLQHRGIAVASLSPEG